MSAPPRPKHTIDAHLLCPSSAFLGECPLWRKETSEICWVDIQGKTFFRRRFSALAGSPSKKSPLEEKTYSYPLPEMPGSFCLCDDGRLIFAFKGGLAYYDPEKGPSSLERIADFEPDLPTRMNDGRVDPMGRFVVGGYNASGEKISSIYRLDPATMKVETLLEKVACTNSICFTGGGGGEGEGGEGDGGADGDGDGDSGDDPAKKCAMYFTDSMAMPRQIFRVGDYGTSGGKVHRGSPFVTWSDDETRSAGPGKTALPDGSVIDSEGNLWNAQFGRGRVVRYDAKGNETLVVNVPVPHVTCLAFGGPDRRHIFITNASRKVMTPGEQADLPEGYAGGLFVAKVPDGEPGGPQDEDEPRFGLATAARWERRRAAAADRRRRILSRRPSAVVMRHIQGGGILLTAAAVAILAALLRYNGAI